MTRPVLVTGGAGFIGSAVVRQLVRETDREVVNLDALTYAGTRASFAGVADDPNHRFEQVDVRDREAVLRVFEDHRPGAVLHLAAETHVDRSIDDPDAFLETNALGTLHLLEAARRTREGLPADEADAFRFVHVSTDEVYGEAAEGEAFDEDSPYAPNSPYAASKAAADHLVRAWHRTHGLPAVVTHASNCYGPFQFPEKLIPHVIARALEGEPLPVYGDGQQVRDWLHVDDHARALRRVLARGEPGTTYCVGARSTRTNLEVVEAICAALDELAPREDGAGHAERIAFVEDRPGHDRRYALDPSRLEAATGWSPRVDFDEGLRRTVAWYLEHEDWWRPLRERRYGGERLGSPA